MDPHDVPTPVARLRWASLWLAAAVLAYEISLMRILLVTGWHHFAFLVISTALLGFGASGTVLTLARRWLTPRRDVLLVLAAATAVSMPLSVALAQRCGVETRLVPSMLVPQLAAWTGYWALLTLPFLLGGAGLALALMAARRELAQIYAWNLFGSGAGAVAAPLLMLVLPPDWLPAASAVPALVAAAGVASPRRALPAAVGAAVLVGAIALWPGAIDLRVDSYKYGAHLERLARQGTLERIAISRGPRGEVAAYAGDALHDLPFLAPTATPPALRVITSDGHWAGSVLEARSPEDAAVVEDMLMAVAYELCVPRPRVALLGEVGGANTWLALRHDAGTVDVVQPHRAILDLMAGPLRDDGGAVLRRDRVRIVRTEPRPAMERATAAYDLIQLVALEGSAAGSGGVGGLGQDRLMTVQGVSACLDALTADGILMMCRGIQTPPRDGFKILATVGAALRRRGAEDAAEHVVIVRDFLAVCTLVRPRPWSEAELAAVRRVTSTRHLTPVWYAGVEVAAPNQPDALPAAPDGVGDWYTYGARRLLGSRREAAGLVRQWRFDIRPPTDGRPFFLDFCRLRTIGALRAAFGDLWLTRVELAFPFLVVSAVLVTIAGSLMIVLPLPFVRGLRGPARPRSVVVYFAAIGLAYLTLEITVLARLTHLVGDAVLTASITIGVFLVGSGLGSLAAQRRLSAPTRDRTAGFGRLLILVIVLLLVLPLIASQAAALPLGWRCVVAGLVIAPPAYAMGFPMPFGLARLDAAAPAAVPWAWGINGFASVVATPAATIIGMTVGFGTAGAASLALYTVAAACFRWLPDSETGSVG